MEVIGWAMLVLLFGGMALLMGQEMPVKVVVMIFAIAVSVAGWVAVVAYLIAEKG